MSGNEPVSNVDISCKVLQCGHLLQKRRETEMPSTSFPAQLLNPLLKAVHIGPGDSLTVPEHVQALVKTGLATVASQV